MPAYILARIEVTDPMRYKEYTDRTPPVLAEHGGRFLVRGGPVTVLEGPDEKRRLVVIEFPSVEKAKAFFKSPGYDAAKQFRIGAARAEFLVVEGVPEVAPG
jgi:uncharacterized protein (DUF1330 family)